MSQSHANITGSKTFIIVRWQFDTGIIRPELYLFLTGRWRRFEGNNSIINESPPTEINYRRCSEMGSICFILQKNQYLSVLEIDLIWVNFLWNVNLMLDSYRVASGLFMINLKAFGTNMEYFQYGRLFLLPIAHNSTKVAVRKLQCDHRNVLTQ